ncbi:BTB/POZ domain-containing protein 6-B [Patella vulgata]|uniref:BTB/POZ domain-containing protein 6-B n=1 Tax=Patella vulgata TaxID=6465 RepID=UPI0021801E92|nr:BTB/POZ domain-containing protein 6-B [Patella vulgata]XP_050404483.1 BTB/POZ domain-containing protein 6-B [Patella vulgata]XP_050404484.1 BTB/POZ domain-containing protein 6-B [Patella vulgata]
MSIKSCIPSTKIKDEDEVNQEVPTSNFVTQPTYTQPSRHSLSEHSGPISWQPYSAISRRSPPPAPTPLPTSKASEDHNWQATQTTVRERNAVMFNNSLMSDVQFTVGISPNQQVIPAHTYVLATGSTVFFAMFHGGLASETKEVEIPDVEPQAFYNLLRYLYCDEIRLEPDNVLATLYAAKKYIVPHLAKVCVDFLETSLSARNACVLLSQGRLFEEVELMQRCWEVIDAQAEEAFKSDGFSDIDYKTLETILSRETLNAKELSIFQAVCRWSEAECKRQGIDVNPENQRKVLGGCLHLLRIPTMSLGEFANGPAQSGILTLEEANAIFLNYTARKKPLLAFNYKHRKGLQQYHVHRFQSSAYRSNQWRYRGRCDSIQFSVDRRIFVAGFGLYGSSKGAAEYQVRIELKKNGLILGQNITKFKSDGSSNIFPVKFDNPIQVEPETYYTASAVLDGTELSYFGQEGLAEIQCGKVTFQFQCSSDSTNGTGVQGGQIPELIFYS